MAEEELPEWAKGYPEDLIQELRERDLLLPGGPGLQEVPGKPGVWVHPAPWGRRSSGKSGGASRRSGDSTRKPD